MPRIARALFIAPLLALSACAATSTAAPAHSATADMHRGQAVAEEVPATARMVCSDDIKRKVQQALQLDAPPPTRDSWSAGVYTCRYLLPMGEMTLSDRIFRDAGAARAHLAAEQARNRSAQPLAGLGQQAYGSDGEAVVLKDDQILTVDTTDLPPVFGGNDQRRTDLAFEIASDVLGCWTGDE